MKFIVTLDVIFLYRGSNLSSKTTEGQISSVHFGTEVNVGKIQSESNLFSFLGYSYLDLLTESLKCLSWILRGMP